uniref:Alpha N-terminal protein methyltransferase 1 n=1 Tax=Hyaloperonospora arabidopsidis (strain Emoy2) TaxID=559515 RepID=M4BKJ4_HYAAE
MLFVLPTARRSSSFVDWEELRVIATRVQQALDASKRTERHNEYETVFSMWQAQLSEQSGGNVEEEGTKGRQFRWYTSAHDYWNDETNCPTTDDGVLGGFAHVSGVDIRESKRFLKHVRDTVRPEWVCYAAADCGAGIGRVSKLLLAPMFDHVDLVEQSARLLRAVPQYFGTNEMLRARVRNLYCMGLQDFEPARASYDLIWMQWVLVHLTDVDLVRYLKRCKEALTSGGFIVIKENIFQTAEPYDLDRRDSSITRSAVYYKSLFQQAGLTLLAERRQRHFPEELYPVQMYALA